MMTEDYGKRQSNTLALGMKT